MLLVHLSDLHLSRYGESGTWSEREEDRRAWESLESWQRWSIDGLKDKKGRPEKLRLVDPEGVVHVERSWPRRDDTKAINTLLSLAMERQLTSAEALVASRPEPDDLAAMLRVDPHNTNLLFLRLLDAIAPLEPDAIAITGDMTDNGFGYRLIQHFLAPWIERERLLVVPGNHDTYDMFPRKGRRARLDAKWERYVAFAQAVGCEPGRRGAYLRMVDDVAIIGLNSCKPPLTILGASGEVPPEQLAWLKKTAGRDDVRGARLRLALVHHHILRMPFELGRRTPIEMAMRLRNAVEVMDACTEAGVDLLLHGHRHHGYAVQLPGHPHVVSSPSSTLGCKSTHMRYVWCVDLAAPRPQPYVHRLPFDGAHPKPGRR